MTGTIICIAFFTALVCVVSWLVVEFLKYLHGDTPYDDLKAKDRKWFNFWASLALISTALLIVELIVLAILFSL